PGRLLLPDHLLPVSAGAPPCCERPAPKGVGRLCAQFPLTPPPATSDNPGRDPFLPPSADRPSLKGCSRMTCLRWMTALLLLFCLASEAAAQAYLIPSPYGVRSGGASLTYSRGRPGKGLSLSLGSFTTRGFYADPFAPFGVFPYGPGARVTVVYAV